VAPCHFLILFRISSVEVSQIIFLVFNQMRQGVRWTLWIGCNPIKFQWRYGILHFVVWCQFFLLTATSFHSAASRWFLCSLEIFLCLQFLTCVFLLPPRFLFGFSFCWAVCWRNRRPDLLKLLFSWCWSSVKIFLLFSFAAVGAVPGRFCSRSDPIFLCLEFVLQHSLSYFFIWV
jgi:hypothetical protein